MSRATTRSGFAVHVPHYLAQAEFADGAVTALNAITAATGLNLPIDELVAAAGLNRAEIAREVDGSDEVEQVVAALERQYDTFMEGLQKPSLLATDVSELPSAEEIGAEFEQFLREVNEDGGESAHPARSRGRLAAPQQHDPAEGRETRCPLRPLSCAGCAASRVSPGMPCSDPGVPGPAEAVQAVGRDADGHQREQCRAERLLLQGAQRAVEAGGLLGVAVHARRRRTGAPTIARATPLAM